MHSFLQGNPITSAGGGQMVNKTLTWETCNLMIISFTEYNSSWYMYILQFVFIYIKKWDFIFLFQREIWETSNIRGSVQTAVPDPCSQGGAAHHPICTGGRPGASPRHHSGYGTIHWHIIIISSCLVLIYYFINFLQYKVPKTLAHTHTRPPPPHTHTHEQTRGMNKTKLILKNP